MTTQTDFQNMSLGSLDKNDSSIDFFDQSASLQLFHQILGIL